MWRARVIDLYKMKSGNLKINRVRKYAEWGDAAPRKLNTAYSLSSGVVGSKSLDVRSSPGGTAETGKLEGDRGGEEEL